MPPRKSTESRLFTTIVGEDDTPVRVAGKGKDGLGVEDLTLPRTMIQRLAKGMLPSNTQIQKDALLAIHKSATVFVSYLADSANDRAVLANKKTIQPKDVLEALAELEFEGFLPRCEKELELYNTIQCTKRNDYRRRVKEEREAASESAIAAADAARVASGENSFGQGMISPRDGTSNGTADQYGDFPPASKRVRISLVAGGARLNGVRDEGGDDTVSEEDGDVDEQSEEDLEEDVDEEGTSGEEEAGDDIDDTEEMGGEARYGLEDDEGGSESE